MKVHDLRETSIYAIIDWSDLRRLLLDKIHQQLDGSESSQRIKNAGADHIEIKIEQETEGSPAYSVGKWRARVKILVTSDYER